MKKINQTWWMRSLCAVALAVIIGLSVGGSTTVLADVSTVEDLTESKPGFGNVTITSGTLNVRESPTTSSSIIGSLAKGSRVMIVGEAADFYKVMYTTSGDYGYASKGYISFVSSSYYLVVKNVDSTSSLTLRAATSTSSSALAKIPYNGSLAYYSTDSSGWYQGIYGPAQGYVSSAYADRKPY